MSIVTTRANRRLRMIASSPSVLVGLTRLADLGVVLLAGWLAYALRHDSVMMPMTYVAAVGVGMALTANAFQVAGLYRFEVLESVGSQLGRIIAGWTAVSLILLAIGFFSKTSADYSRIWVGIWLGLGFATLMVFRLGLARQIAAWKKSGVMRRNVVIVGTGAQAERLIRYVREQQADIGTDLQAVFSVRPNAGRRDVLGVPVKGDLKELLLYVRGNQVQEVMVALPWDDEEQIGEVLTRLREAPIDVSLAPEPLGYRLMGRRMRPLGGLPMTVVQEAPLSGWSYIVKGLEDRILSLLIIAAISPLLALIALAVRLDSPGPAIFRQQRYGFNNNVFTVYKFHAQRHGRQPRRRPGDEGRSAHHPARRLPPALQPRRVAAALQRPERRHVAGRPAPARGRPQRGICRPDRPVSRPPQGQARHHRLGADPRPARRDRYARQDGNARSV